jgi:putative MATE family efflux protein
MDAAPRNALDGGGSSGGGGSHLTGELDTSVLVRSPYRAILTLALPTVFAMLSQSVVNEIDVVFFSRLPCPESSNGQAALLPSLIIVWLFGGSLSAVNVGALALTARRVAERKHAEAGAVLANAAWFCLVAGAFISVVGWLLLPRILGLMIESPDVRAVALSYSRWRMMGVISMAMTMAIKGFFDGIGRTHVHLVAAIVMNVFNVLFCYCLVFGNLGAPRMGVTGAGVAGFLATWIGLFIMIAYAAQLRARFHPVRWSNLSRKLTWDILKLSIPAAVATAVMMFGFGLFTRIVGQLDAADADVAATVPGQCGAAEAVFGAATTDIVEILKLTFTACIAFGTATATLVGQSLGARRPGDAEKFGWASVRLGLVIFGVVGLCEGVLFTPQIVHFISRSDAVRHAAMVPMRMMGIVTPVIAVALILSEALFGAGNPRFVAVAQLALIFGCLLPLAYVLGIVEKWNLVGIWAAACVYGVLAAVTMSTKFRLGGWKSIHL